jgi:hypothetical protein
MVPISRIIAFQSFPAAYQLDMDKIVSSLHM